MKRCRSCALSFACLAIGAASGVALSRLADAGAETKTADGVILYDAKEVAEAFSKGRMILGTEEYKIMAGHREKAGIPEVHDRDTDVFYILAGEATFVTGGKVLDPRTESAGETRGSRIEGGKPHALKKGDVLVIPRGVPHWFSEVPKLVDYFVVKVTAPAGKDAKAVK
jgi:mannose-6-phosphate isomerase-like protein (cupin superfamily)